MSFNSDDKKNPGISRNNYEEYFLLYADNELTPEERLQVEQFVLAHPDLQVELDILLSAKLPAEEIKLDDKEWLLAENMKLNAVDENLLLYLDNELSTADKKKIEEKLTTDNAYQLQYNALLQTRLVAEEVNYPYKKELYRSTERRRSFGWIRIAAAAIILIGIGVLAFTYQQKPDTTVAATPQKTEERNHVTATENKSDVAIKNKATETVTPDVPGAGKTDDATAVIRDLKKKAIKQKEVKKEIVMPVEKAVNNDVTQNKNQQEEQNISVHTAEKNIPQQSLNNNDVTPPIVASLNDQTKDVIPAGYTDVVKIDNEKKSSLKGLLRKATRFIERRTNISTTNENNELVIGAVAVKL